MRPGNRLPPLSPSFRVHHDPTPREVWRKALEEERKAGQRVRAKAFAGELVQGAAAWLAVLALMALAATLCFALG